MARQAGYQTITGSYGNLCFYQLEGAYYVRMKSSLSRRRVKTDAAFANTMQHARLLAAASKLASVVYLELDDGRKVKGFFRKLTGEIMQQLKRGVPEKEVQAYFEGLYLNKQPKKSQVVCAAVRTDLYLPLLLADIFQERLPETYSEEPVANAPP